MDIKKNFNQKTLLDLKFEKNVKGYNALQVDQTLDRVIEDYKQFEKEIQNNAELLAKNKETIESLKAKLNNANLEIAKLKKQIESMPKVTDANKDSTYYLKRIDTLEKALWKKGINPNNL